MKRISIITAGIFMIAASSCSKNELRSEQLYTAPVVEATAAAAPSTATVSAWQPVSEWSAVQEGKAHSGSISNAAITTGVADNGLVLVFAQKGNSTQSLPYTDGDVYWNYQVEEGKVVINAAGTKDGMTIDRQQAFQYVVLSKEQLDVLETKGITKNELINLSYSQAMEIAAGK